MKIRKGFVSNSSSSSYICDISGEIESGWDLSLEDAGMYQCVNEHIFQDEFLIVDVSIEDKRIRVETDDDLQQEEIDNANKMKDTEFKKWYDDAGLSKYGIPSAFCPICIFENIIDRELLQYLLKKSLLTMKDAVKQIQTEFKDYSSFSNYLKHDHVELK